ncbi:MAG: SURF1 family protein [Luteimonas sp.]
MSLRRTRIVGWTAAVVTIVAFVSLGQWQLSRMHQKQAMLDAVATTLTARDAVPLSVAGDAARARDYDWSAGPGRFVDRPAFVLDNQIRAGVPGLRVYRLFAPERGAPLLVDLGWTPLADRATRLPDAAIVRGDGLLDRTLELRGLLAPPPSAGLALGPALVPGDAVLMTRIELDAIAAEAGLPALPPRVLRLDPALETGYDRDLDVLPNTLTPDKHLGYAVQWFGLALAVLVIALVLTFRKRRRCP